MVRPPSGLLRSSLVCLAAVLIGTLAPTADTTTQALPFAQNWSNESLISTSDDWSAVPGVVGYRGDGLAGTTGVDPRTVLGEGTSPVVDVNANQASPNTFTTGGVAEFAGANVGSNPVVALQGSGTARAPYLLITVSTAALSNITVAYNLRDIDGSADNAVQPVALQFRVGTSGDFTNVAAGYVADATTGPSAATLVTPVSAVLPAEAANQAVVQVRILTTDAPASDEWVGVDDISITGSTVEEPTNPSGTGAADPNPVERGADATLTVAVTPGLNPASTGIGVVVDLSAIGGSAAQAFSDDGSNGDAVADDLTFSYRATVAASTPPGLTALAATITDAQARSGTATINLNVTLPITPVTRDVVISQLYGGGGNSGATYTHDFIELFNTGNAPVNLAGWSVQYASSSGSAWSVTPLSGEIQPGEYFLVQQAPGAGGTTPLPAPDAVGGIPMAAGAGKVALVGSADALSGTCPASVQIADFVGYGGANCFEGPGPAPALSNTTAAVRGNFGCFDSDENNNDFTAGVPAPRNSAAPLQSCAGFPALLSVGDVSVAEGDSGTTTATFTVSLSSRAPVGGVTFDIATADGTATVAGSDYVARTLTAQTIPAGQRFYSFDVVINGDTVPESREIFFVNVSGVSGAEIRDGQGTGTILSSAGEFPAAAIHTIQGAGLSTPLLGQDVTSSGIVTGLKVNGFFLQTPDAEADSDPGTSQGIFVFTGGAPSVGVGSAVIVSGMATEFFDLTQIESTQPGYVALQSVGNPLPVPVMLTAASLTPNGGLTQLEPYEGMRVHADTLVSVAPTNGFGETFTVFGGVPRPMREPGIDITLPVPPDPTSGEVEAGIPRWDRNPERLIIAAPLDAPLTSNVTITNVTGPLDFSFSNYKVLPDAPLVRSADITARAVPQPAANEFTVAGYNIENFTGNEAQRRKAALAIRTVMRSPDVIGTIEIGSLAALEALAAQVNSDAVAAGEANPGYVARLIPAGGTQHVGFLIKTSRVQIDSVTRELADETFPAGGPDLLHDRPPLVLRATINAAGLAPEPIIVVVNHLRSFIDIDLLSAEGVRVRAKRTAQAESLAVLLQELQTANPRTPVISVGDYNAYEFNDGYTDPMAILKGAPTPDDQIVVDASPDSVNPNFVNLTESLPADQRYSFVFEGTPQALDHVIVNASAAALVQRYAIARNNADFSRLSAVGSDVTRPEANSDHDMPVAYFAFTGTPVVTLNGGATMTVEAYTSFVDPGATARDGQGPLPVTVSGAVDVNVPGEYTITYTAANALAETSVTRTVVVVDTTAPSIAGFSLTPTALGAPNHLMVDVALQYTSSDAGGIVTCTVSVSSNEAVNGPGDGNTAADWEIVSAHHVRLRAERAGHGSGRIYTVTLTCVDGAGNQSSATGTATVGK